METVCQACGYQRKLTDQAPDWQCPSCGKAYAKTSHDSPASLIANVEQYPAKSGNQLNTKLSYQQRPIDADFGERRLNSNRGWVFGIVLAIFLVWDISILTDPSSASAVLLQGDAALAMFVFLALMAVAVVMRHLVAGIDMNDPKSKFSLSAKLMALICAVFFIAFAIPLNSEERAAIRIQNNGQRAMGDVVRIYTGACGKHSDCLINVEYAFTPTADTSGTSKPIHGYGHLGSSSRPQDPNFVYARTNKQVPIAYQVDHPEVSALNFNDDVFRADHVRAYRSTVTLLGNIFLAVFLVGTTAAGIGFWLSPKK
jgi:hypothetical protein